MKFFRHWFFSPKSKWRCEKLYTKMFQLICLPTLVRAKTLWMYQLYVLARYRPSKVLTWISLMWWQVFPWIQIHTDVFELQLDHRSFTQALDVDSYVIPLPCYTPRTVAFCCACARSAWACVSFSVSCCSRNQAEEASLSIFCRIVLTSLTCSVQLTPSCS